MPKISKSLVLNILAIIWGLLILSTLVITQTVPFQRQATHVSDFVTTFYVAGAMVMEGKTQYLYPPAGATTFIGAPFQACAHLILEHMPANLTSMYLYMPIVAVFFAPFSGFAPHHALLAFQLVTISSLVVSTLFIRKAAMRTARELGGESSTKPGFWGWFLFAYFPVVLTLWQGQVGIVFGVLPIAIAFYLLSGNRDFLAGLVWSLAISKPQFLFPAGLVVLLRFLEKKWSFACGVVVGLVLIALLNVIVLGPEMTIDWLRVLKLTDALFSNPQWAQPRLMASLPRALSYFVPFELQDAAKPLIYAPSLVCLAAAGWQVFSLAKSNLPPSLKLSLTVLLGLVLTPLVVPHLFLYDLSILIPAGLIVFSYPWPVSMSWRLKMIFILGWVLTDAYCLFAIRVRNVSYPIIMVLFLVDMFRRLVLAVHAETKPASGRQAG